MRRKSQAGAATANFVWDARNVLLETDGGGTTQATYTHRPGAGGLRPRGSGRLAGRRAGPC